MFAQCINCPTGLILRGIERRPCRLDKIDEASLKMLRLLVVAPARGSYLKFSAPGTDEFEEAIHRIAFRFGLRATAATPPESTSQQAALQAAATHPGTFRKSFGAGRYRCLLASAASPARG